MDYIDATDEIVFSSGKKLATGYSGIIGIPFSKENDSEFDLFYVGFDDSIKKETDDESAPGDDYHWVPTLTPEEKKELAEHMIQRWKEFGGIK